MPSPLLAACMLGTAFIGAGLDQRLAERVYRVPTRKLKTAARPVRACVLSDLHDIAWGKSQSLLLPRIHAGQPDLILLAGDIFESGSDMQNALCLLDGLDRAVPAFFVSGSHDIVTWRMPQIRRALESRGIAVLRNERHTLLVRGERIDITGVDEPFQGFVQGIDRQATGLWYDQKLAALPPPKPEHFSLLLAHRPERAPQYAAMGYDLSVTGHAHGGQVRLPLVMNGLYAPNQGLFPRYGGGLYRVGDLTHIVSRGLHRAWTRPRFFNRPELVFIDIVKE